MRILRITFAAFGAVVLNAACGSPPRLAEPSKSVPTPAVAQAVGSSPADIDAVLRALAGSPIGAPSAAIKDLPPPHVLSAELRTLPTPQPVLGVMPLDTTYRIVGDELAGVIWSMEDASGTKLFDLLAAKIGPRQTGGSLAWAGAELALHTERLFGKCLVFTGQKKLFDPSGCYWPKSSAPARFGVATLGARRQTFVGLKKAPTGAPLDRPEPPKEEYYDAAKAAYDGVELTSLTYAFAKKDDKLVSVGFDAKGEPCVRLIERLRATFGSHPTSAPNFGGGTSYRWFGKGYELVYNDFGEKCSGIMRGSTCQ
jgi:hypothetical protein